MATYTFVGTNKPSYHVDCIELDDGRVILLGLPIELSDDEVEALRSKNLIFEQTSAEEAEAVNTAFNDWRQSEEAKPVVGDDVTGTAPLIGGANSNESATSGTDTPSKEVNN